MAQINLTLNQEEILELLGADKSEAFKALLTKSLNAVLKAESAQQLGAEPYERSKERCDCRNGFRERTLNTRIGSIVLAVPRHCNVPFKSMIFDNYSRSEAALMTTMAEMVVLGVSTRKVAKVMETLCGNTFSKSAVSEACKELDDAVNKFQTRPLTGEYPFLTVDATYFKVRENGRIVSKALLIAYATNQNGYREIVGFQACAKESKESWKEFIGSLKKRGLSGVKIIISDAHEGIVSAVSQVYSDVPWQRCQYHFAKNISEAAPKKYQAGLRAELNAMFQCETISEAPKKRDEIIAEYHDVAEAAMSCLDNGFESAMTIMVLSKGLRRYYRTSNHIERLNKELKRRSKVIGVFPNTQSLLRLMGSLLLHRNEIVQARRVFSSNTLLELQKLSPRLKKIAEEQRALLAA